MAYKTFSNGDVLNASEINDNLMNQSVMVFTGTSTRSAALPSPLEGMLTYREDTHEYEGYDGAAWVPVVGLDNWKTWAPVLSGGSNANGNGTWDAAYSQIGKTIHFRGQFTLGSTSVISSTIQVSFPVAALAKNVFSTAWAKQSTTRVMMFNINDAGDSTLIYQSTSTATASQVRGTPVTTTVPFTWATGNQFYISGTYEAA